MHFSFTTEHDRLYFKFKSMKRSHHQKTEIFRKKYYFKKHKQPTKHNSLTNYHSHFQK